MDVRHMALRRTKTTLLNQGHADEKREEIRQYFHATFSLDEQLYETLVTDLGCAVGRASFDLAREFAAVTGIDFSARFIRVALQLQIKGHVHYELIEEGDVVSYHEARLSDHGLEGVVDRVEFCQGDATNLKPQFIGYDLILAANLIDRLFDPRKFLTTIHERLNLGGVLVISSPYTWLEEFTKKEDWLGGSRNGISRSLVRRTAN